MRFLAKLGIKPGVLNGDGRMRGQGRKITYFLFAEFVLGCRDDIEDPNRLRVRFWNNGALYHDYVTDDMEHRVPELIEFASRIMTLHTGNVIACG